MSDPKWYGPYDNDEYRCTAGGAYRIRHGGISLRRNGPKYAHVSVDAHGRRVEVLVSPTGRSVQVHVDGQRVEALTDE